jgi:hypothetical protein
MRGGSGLVFVAAIACLMASAGRDHAAILVNPTDHDRAYALVRIGGVPAAAPFAVLMDGSEVPYQVIDGEVWVDEAFGARSSHRFSFSSRPPVRGQARVSVKVDEAKRVVVLSNGIVEVQLPWGPGELRGPIGAIRTAGGGWAGESFWKTSLKLKNFTCETVADGAAFGRVRLRYQFDEGFAEAEVTLEPGRNFAEIFEKHSMPPGDYWEFDAAKGWGAREGISRRFSDGPPDGSSLKALGAPTRKLLPGGLPFCRDELFISLSPRWNQHYRDGWFFAASDGSSEVGALAVRAGEWIWPVDNQIDVVVKPTGDYAGLRCPTFRGQRLWWLFASAAAAAPGIGQVRDSAWQNLEKLNEHYLLGWPGVTSGHFPDINWFDDSSVNPTHRVRQQGKAALMAAANTGDLTTLYTVQEMLDPDTYGSYWTHESPENPNFFTDFIRVPIALSAQLRTHPQFEIIRKFVEQRFKEDLYNSVTLPGGAGQECPGYLQHAIESWASLAPVCRQYLAFDPSSWERYAAAKYFLERISQPSGRGRMALPIGDTHPGPNGPRPVQVAPDEVANFETEELPGFGVVFNNRPGSPQETYVAFKAGPNRGHYHGDQLAFHFCADAAPIAVFHHSSYNPRAGQEHMCNRVAFSAGKFQYANMDGYERLIGFKTSHFADIAVAQVESTRLRQVEKFPPEKWDQAYPKLDLGGTLKYRRTLVFMKNGPRDYLVIRDQFSSPLEVNATYCLHVLADSMRVTGNRVEWPRLTLYCVKPKQYEIEAFPWSHENGGRESTQGIRLTQHGMSGEFITVVYPGRATSVRQVKDGVTDDDDEILFRGGFEDGLAPASSPDFTVVRVSRGTEQLVLMANDIDLNRSQGQIGLFVPDAGYPLGPIPDWLIGQRGAIPAWGAIWWK